MLKYLTVFIILHSTCLWADADTSTVPSAEVGHKGGRGGSKKSKSEKSNKIKSKNKISGQCTIVEGRGSFTAGPCINLALKLISESDKDIIHTRTSNTGTFEFVILSETKYKIEVESKFYEVLSPIESVEHLKKINLQIKQK